MRVECPEPVEGLCFIYFLLCNDGSIYVGQTADVAARFRLHCKGCAARHAQAFRQRAAALTQLKSMKCCLERNALRCATVSS